MRGNSGRAASVWLCAEIGDVPHGSVQCTRDPAGRRAARTRTARRPTSSNVVPTINYRRDDGMTVPV